MALLHSLSAHADNGISLSKSALPSVLATLLRHGDHPSVVLGGLGCLANLSLPVDNRSVLMGAVPTLLTTLQRRCDPEAVLAAVHGLTALRLLSTVWDNTMVLTEQVRAPPPLLHHARSCAHTHMHMHTCIHAHMLTHTHTNTRICAHTCTQTRTHTHLRARYTRANTRTHTAGLPESQGLLQKNVPPLAPSPP